MKGSLDFSPGLFCACLQVIPGLILPALQGFDGFVVFDHYLDLSLVRSGLEQKDLRVPFLQLSIEHIFVCFSFFFLSKLLICPCERTTVRNDIIVTVSMARMRCLSVDQINKHLRPSLS